MSDKEIVDLYFARSEKAVELTQGSFGALMRSIAKGILKDPRDAEEAVSDALLSVWNSIPPLRPKSLKAYVSKLTRNAAIDKLKHTRRKKRGGGEYDAVLDEVRELASREGSPEDALAEQAFIETLNSFLSELPARKRNVFVQRYWYLLPIKRIAAEHDTTEAAVKTELSRLRTELRERLKREKLDYE